MYLQQINLKYVVDRQINTRAHDATVFETCIPHIEKYKSGAIYRGIQLWNNLNVNIRNIDSYLKFKEAQKKWSIDVTVLNI